MGTDRVIVVPILVVVVIIEIILTALLILAAGKAPRGRRNDPPNGRKNA